MGEEKGLLIRAVNSDLAWRGRKEVVEGKDGGQKVCCLHRSFPQVPRNELRWVRGAGEEVGYGVGVPTATCGTGGISGEAYRSSEVVQGDTMPRT